MSVPFRRLYFGFILGVLLGTLTIMAFHFFSGKGGITNATCDKIRIGMAPDEVSRLLACPSLDELPRKEQRRLGHFPAREIDSDMRHREWISVDGSAIYVLFFRDRVADKNFRPSNLKPWTNFKRQVRHALHP